MMGALTIAVHEIARRWHMLVAALCLGAVPHMLYGHSWTTDRVVDLCFFALVLLSWVIAFVIGMTLLGRPLHDGRLAFYFTRPIHGAAVAGGKLLGAAVLMLGTEWLLVRPIGDAILFHDQPSALVGVVITAAFLAAGLVVGILARSRSRWFVVDAAGATIVTFVVAAMFDRINYREGQIKHMTYVDARRLVDHVDILLNGAILVAIAVMMLAAVTAIAIGRTDRDRVHRTLSLTLWPLFSLTALTGVAIAAWGLS